MRNLDIPTLEEDNVRTALAIYGIKAELEMGGGGTPEIIVGLFFGRKRIQLHYATYAYEGFCVETYADGYFEEHPCSERLEIDRTRPIGKQIVNYLDRLGIAKAVN